MTASRVIGIMTVRDEADILRETLTYATQVYDHVYAVDCGSEDDSASIMEDISKRAGNLTFLGCVGPKIAKQVRRHVWERTRKNFSWSDWYIIADADEFVHEDYRNVINHASKTNSDHIFGEFVNYYYTESDAMKWYSGVESLADRQKSIRNRRRYYSFNTSQVRAFRNLPWLRWNHDTSFPVWFSRPSELRIQFFHYQYRDIPQIERRIRIRRSVFDIADASNKHWNKKSIEEAISSDFDRELRYDACDGTYIPSSRLPPPPQPQGIAKTFAKYSRAVTHGMLKRQTPSDWFAGPVSSSSSSLANGDAELTSRKTPVWPEEQIDVSAPGEPLGRRLRDGES